jgi:hypothetical protein
MTDLEHKLRLSLINEHFAKAEGFVRRANLAINPSVRLVLMAEAGRHLEEAEQLRDELQAAS